VKKDDGNPPEAEEKVGYCRPPRMTRFKPGQSGNPLGRPRKPKPIQDLLATELRRTLVIRENDREQKLPKLEIVVKRLVNDAVQGNHPAVRLLIDLLKVSEEGPDSGLRRTIGDLSTEDREILARYLLPGATARKDGDDGA
jgi:hypothetical protein